MSMCFVFRGMRGWRLFDMAFDLSRQRLGGIFDFCCIMVL